MTKKVFGVLAEFDSAAAIYAAAEKIRDARYSKWDTHTPFPVHGLERAMGLSRSKLPFLVFIAGMAGAGGGMALQRWTSAVDYPVIIAAKPFFSWQAFVPITFELGVLAAAGAAVVGMLFINRLPQWHHSLLKTDRFKGASDDRFFVSIEAEDSQFDAERTPAFLRELGASHVELVED